MSGMAAVREAHQMAYHAPNYRMGPARKRQAIAVLASLPPYLSLLDVGCGRGEILDYASDYANVTGLELVPDLCDGGRVLEGALPYLPFGGWSFEVVTCLDVLEHIPESLAEASVKELGRVAERYLVLTISNLSDRRNEIELHVNRRPYEEWHALLTEWLPDFNVERCGIEQHRISECWIGDRT